MGFHAPDTTLPDRRLFADEADFPRGLLGIPRRPDAIYLRGRLPDGPAVALVGARRCDAYGLRLARTLGADLARNRVAVVSGGAQGVDTAALQGCLEADGHPVAVLGTGLDIAYPAENRHLFAQVARQGALVSEYPPGTPGLRAHFPQRNRIISGLADAVVVVRAAERSGSLITAREAMRQGRRLMAVPGPVGDALSGGVHALLRNGALLVEDARDILAAMRLPSARQMSFSLEAEPIQLDSLEARLYDLLSDGALPIDVLAHRSDLSVAAASVALLQMEFKGVLQQMSGMRYVRKQIPVVFPHDTTATGARQHDG